MTRRLVLMRHAKSSWTEVGAPDHDRILNMRGRLAATLMGAWLQEQSWSVDRTLISTSARTRETWERMNVHSSTVQYLKELYHADQRTLWRLAHAADDAAQTLLIIAHNPGLEALLRNVPNGPRRMPTAAVAVLEIDGSWAEAGPLCAQVAAYEEPKSLV